MQKFEIAASSRMSDRSLRSSIHRRDIDDLALNSILGGGGARAGGTAMSAQQQQQQQQQQYPQQQQQMQYPQQQQQMHYPQQQQQQRPYHHSRYVENPVKNKIIMG